jgi:multicomponent Na+:H+ antiporter subunit B
VRPGSAAVARGLGKRIAPLLLLLAVLALVGDPHGGGLQAGLIFAAAVAMHTVVFGVRRAMTAFPPALLRTAGVWGACLAAGAGVFAATGGAFEFIVVDISRMPVSVGGALLHLAAFVAVGGVTALVFLCLAGRATPLDDAR